MSDEAMVGAAGKKFVSFLNVISLGNILILVGMIGTGMVAIYEVGTQVQKLEDAVMHESTMRETGERQMTTKLEGIAKQEAADVGGVKDTLVEVRNDIRQLVFGQNQLTQRYRATQ